MNVMNSFWAVFVIVALILATFLAQHYFCKNMTQAFGLQPQRPKFWSMLMSSMLHADTKHLLGNLSNFIPVAAVIIAIWGNIHLLFICAVAIAIAGMGIIFVGQRNSTQLGFSGVVFGLLGFLLADCIRCIFWDATIPPRVAIDIVFLLWYRRCYWSLLSSGPSSSGRRISVEGHLFGFLGGVVACVCSSTLG
jgi:membrane associated rhomboid family serine protease